jgi:2-polyprenyl-6-methoxyphenol hydroxylase-like FAD-dependent oxidoreductase
LGERRDIVIAGAGIGGLTAALTLAARGFRTTVCERANKLSEIGAGIQLSPNVGHVLKSLGLDKALATAASEPAALEIRSGPSGRRISTIPLKSLGARYDAPWRVIARAELQAVLTAAAATNPNVELRLGAEVKDLVGSSDDLLVGTETRNGRVVQPALALIAADGVSSQLREKIPGASRARPIGRTAWRATISARAAENIVPADCIGLWLGPEAHLVHYPIAGGRTINIVAIVEENWTGVGWSEPGDHYQLAEYFSGWSRTARAIVSAPAEWRKWAILAVNPTGPWVADRLALLGDSAHAMPPFLAQGAAMAIEDAAVLAACFAVNPDNAAGALAAYEAARKPRVTRLHKAAYETGKHYHYGGALAAMRDAALWLAGPNLAMTRNDWIYGWKPTT